MRQLTGHIYPKITSIARFSPGKKPQCKGCVGAFHRKRFLAQLNHRKQNQPSFLCHPTFRPNVHLYPLQAHRSSLTLEQGTYRLKSFHHFPTSEKQARNENALQIRFAEMTFNLVKKNVPK